MAGDTAPLLRIGIDVGGTNTDAVLMRADDVLASHKSPTSADVTRGVSSAIGAVIEQSGVSASDIVSVMVGTTHFVNAFVQRQGLTPVGILRVGLPMTSGILPQVDWPADLKTATCGHATLVAGGSYYTGEAYAPLDTNAVEAAAAEMSGRGLTAVAISSVFAPIRPDFENDAADIVRQVMGDVHITKSQDVGGLGLVERENAAIINASLHRLADHVVSALQQAMTDRHLSAQLFVTQNDGTLMGPEVARQFPVNTCSAGPTNSIRGAAFLTGVSDAIVVDVGGTTTDVGVLSSGFARETSNAFELGGVRTNFTMPDVLSVGLGGGSIVRATDDGAFTIGPDSVGYQLSTRSRVFGGDTLTTTDVAIGRGKLNLGDRDLVNLSESDLTKISTQIHRLVDTCVEQLKTSATPIPVVLVGGGSVLLDGNLPSASEVMRPQTGSVANAIGAAIAQVGGRTKRLYDYVKLGGRDAAIAVATREATDNAIRAGAQADTIRVVGVEELPMPYMQTDAVDVRVRVVGDLDLSMGGAPNEN